MESVPHTETRSASRSAADAAASSSNRPRTMRAAVIAGPRRIELREQPLPEPAAGELRIRLEGCGVCASNVPVWEGREWFDYPMPPGSPGHEGWGVVDEIGPGVTAVASGDRVALLSESAFAEYDVAPADAVVPLPTTLNDRPLPGEPLGCAMNVLSRSGIRPGQTVAVVGLGFLGASLVSLAKEAGAHVVAVSRREASLRIARQMGADETLPLSDPETAIERTRKRTDGAGCERVIEATGFQAPLDLAADLVGVHGRLVVAGFHQDGPRRVDMQSWNWRGIDVINAHERDPAAYTDGVRRAVDAIQRKRFDPFPLFTHSFSLSNLGEALDAATERPDGFVKALVRMDG